MNDSDSPNEYEPLSWLLVFEQTTTRPWLDRLIPGRFKHVMAIGYVLKTDIWLFYAVAYRRTVVTAVPGSQAGDLVAARVMAGNAVLRMPVRDHKPHLFGFWCVPAVKHLIGLRSGALFPSQLYRHCLKAGAEIINERRP